ncbi:hypothetical protein JCM15519_34500 [Fundidesulfovibrio butyratiphilus]
MSYFASKPLKGKHASTAIIAAVVLLNIIGMAAGGFELLRSRQHSQDMSVVAATNLSQVMEKNLANTLSQVNLTLQSVADEALRQYTQAGHYDVAALNAFIARQHSRLPALDSLRFADESGMIMSGVGVGDKRVSIAGRSYFKRLREDPRAGMVISEPLIGHISGKLVLVLARSLHRPDGSFAGVVYGPITLDYFRKLFNEINVGPHGVISLRDRDFAVIIRTPNSAGGGAMGQRLVSARFKNLVTENPMEGAYFANTASDGVDRVLSYRQIGDYPLFIIIGLAEQDYLASWYTDARNTALTILLFLGFTSWGGGILLHALKEQSRSEERLALLLESAGEGIFGMDLQGTCTFFNPAGLRMLGYQDQSQILGKNVLEAILHTSADKGSPACDECRLLRELCIGRAFHSDEEVFWRVDGTAVPVEYWCSPQEREGNIVGAVITFSDISERKRVEAGLRESEERFRFLVEHAPMPILMLREGKVRYANTKAALAFGYGDAETMLRLAITNLLDRRIPERLAEGSSSDTSFESAGRKKDGSTFNLYVSSTVLNMAEGPMALAFCQDISEAKKTQERIRHLGEALRQSEEAIALFDDQRRFTYVNPAFCRLFGYGEDELYGQPAMVLTGEDSPENGADPMQTSTVARRFGGFRGEVRRKAKNGLMVPLMLNVAPVRDDLDRITGFVSVMTDLTEIKKAQEKLSRMAHFDPLTGLPNRALLSDRLEMGLAAAKRQGMVCALLFIDLDHFKTVNDTLGHHIGDLLLKATADLLRSQVRATDTVARLAGDEFVVFLSDVERADHAALVARKILVAFEHPFILEGHQVRSTPSIGVALYPTDAFDPAGLIKQADKAMYRAKQRGRNAYAFVSETP